MEHTNSYKLRREHIRAAQKSENRRKYRQYKLRNQFNYIPIKTLVIGYVGV